MEMCGEIFKNLQSGSPYCSVLKSSCDEFTAFHYINDYKQNCQGRKLSFLLGVSIRCDLVFVDKELTYVRV